MCPHLMARTDTQRRMDALHAIFLKVAGATTEPTGTGFTVNIIVSEQVFEHRLLTLLSNNPVPPLDPNQPGHRCETADGTPVDPHDMLAAAAIGTVRRVVMNSAGVVTNMGRKQRLFTGPLRDAVLMHSR